jgi:hypothetical protein
MSLVGALFAGNDGRGIIHDNCPHLYRAWTDVPVTHVKDYWVNGWGYPWMAVGSPFISVYRNGTDGSPPGTDANGGFMYYHSPNQTYFNAAYNLPRLVGGIVGGTRWMMNYSSGKLVATNFSAPDNAFRGQVQHYPFYIRKLKAFLQEIPGVGAPLTASIKITDSGRYSIDSIERTTGGWNVYISSAPEFYLRSEAESPIYRTVYFTTSVARYVNQKVYDVVPGSMGLTGVSVSGYASYSSAMATYENTGMVVKNSEGVDIFRFPATYLPITPKSSWTVVPSVPVFESAHTTNDRSSDIIFFGVSQRKDTYDTGLVHYDENAHSTIWRYDCRTIWSRQFIDRNGVVHSIPVANDFTGGETIYVPGSDGLVFGLGSYGSTVTIYNINVNSSGSKVSGGDNEIVVYV